MNHTYWWEQTNRYCWGRRSNDDDDVEENDEITVDGPFVNEQLDTLDSWCPQLAIESPLSSMLTS